MLTNVTSIKFKLKKVKMRMKNYDYYFTLIIILLSINYCDFILAHNKDTLFLNLIMCDRTNQSLILTSIYFYNWF